MESSYSIEPAENLVRLRIWGAITVDGMIELIRRIGRDPGFRHSSMAVLVDMRGCSGDWDYSEIQRYRDYLVHIAQSHKGLWATVVPAGSVEALMHVLIVISEALGDRIRMRWFEEPHQALSWIAEQRV
ncbi:MAG TPA: hypothetical protein VIT67_15905 [Povalibacter sp.]